MVKKRGHKLAPLQLCGIALLIALVLSYLKFAGMVSQIIILAVAIYLLFIR